MEWTSISEVCSPKQWKTISLKNLKEDGYPVYGANGIIGYYDEYTHEVDTLMITCRGATCGSINMSKGKAYINGNAMALDDLNNEIIDIKYFYYYLLEYDFTDIISGSAQPQITRTNLNRLKIPVPPMNIQKQIVEVLDEAQYLIDKRKEQIKLLDDLIESIFYDMFGDPIKNDKGWEVTKLADISKYIGRGRTPKYLEQSNCCVINQACIYWDVIKYENIKYVSGENFKLELENGDLLVTSTGTGTLGRANIFYSLDNSKYTIDSHVTLVRLNKRKLNERYLKCFLKDYNIQRRLYLKCVTGSTNQIELSSRDFKNFDILFPPIQLQNQFAEKVEQIESQKQLLEKSLKLLEENYNSLMQKAFKGELFT